MMQVKSSDKGAGGARTTIARSFMACAARVKGVVMGQAAVDLPDPLAKAPAPATSADDLLSQLAGEEIDRLLADSEQSVPADSADAVKVFGADGEMKQASLPAEAPPAKLDQQAIDQVLDPHVAPQLAPAKQVAVTASTIVETGTSPAERSALEGVTEALDAKAAGESKPDAKIIATESTDLPVILKPLKVISLPLSLFPAGVRDLVGKIAILTLFNAIAVLIYVLMFRTAH
jgi:hypothetical protein